jgi:PTS system cellobiose-specific IIC component
MDKLLYPVGATYDLIAVFATIGTAYRLAQKHEELEPILMGAIALSAYLLVTPYNIAHTIEATGEVINVSGLDIASLGSQGMFLGLMIAIYSTEMCRWLINKKVTIKLPDSVPPAVGQSFTALIPALCVITSLTVLRIGIEHFDIVSVQSIITDVISAPLKMLGGSLIGTAISTLAEHLLWSVGVHGTAITGSIMEPIWLILTDENRQAFQAGLEMPHIITNEFNAIFVNFGGSGGLLALVLLLLVGCNGVKHVIEITEPLDHTEGDDGGKLKYKIIFGDKSQKE